MLLILPICNNYEKYGRGYCYLARSEKKSLLVSQNPYWFAWKLPRKMTGQNG
jgi:hypothetical protein